MREIADVDLVMRPESDAMLRAIPALKERLHLNTTAPLLYRYPAVDPKSYRCTLDEVVPE